MKHRIWIYLFLFLVNFIACKSDQKSNVYVEPASDEALIQSGNEIAQATFQALSLELQKTMKEGGVEKAITYCNINALPITDQLAQEHNAIIKRTSTKYRNPNNAPTQVEVDLLHQFEAQLTSGDELKPILRKVNEQSVFYAPILTQELCLKCHGPKDKIAAYDQILSKYPDDLATGYSSGDLRGMWSIVLLPTKEKSQ